MKITNKYGLPNTIVRAVQVDNHKGADYSATQILNPAKIVLLTKRHENEIEVDASERIWSLRGQAIHSIIERGSGPNDLTELYMEDDFSGVKLSGTCDLVIRENNKTILWDYKDTSAFTLIYKSRIKEWEKQVNIYHYLLRMTKNIKCDEIKCCVFVRDWTKSNSLKIKNYPSKVEVLDMPIWKDSDQLAFILDRLDEIAQYTDTPDDNIPECKSEERWKNDVRCKEYCDCKQFCNFYKGLKSEVSIQG